MRDFAAPFASHVAGVLLQMQFHRKSGDFILKYHADPSIQAPTDIFFPQCQYPHGEVVDCTGATAGVDLPNQKVVVQNPKEGIVQVRMKRKNN
jgi:hypothetical protein